MGGGEGEAAGAADGGSERHLKEEEDDVEEEEEREECDEEGYEEEEEEEEQEGEDEHEVSLYKGLPCSVLSKGDDKSMLQKQRRMTDRTEDTASISSINRGISRDSFPLGHPGDTDGAATDDAADSDCSFSRHRGLSESNSFGLEAMSTLTAAAAVVVPSEGAPGRPSGALACSFPLPSTPFVARCKTSEAMDTPAPSPSDSTDLSQGLSDVARGVTTSTASGGFVAALPSVEVGGSEGEKEAEKDNGEEVDEEEEEVKLELALEDVSGRHWHDYFKRSELPLIRDG